MRLLNELLSRIPWLFIGFLAVSYLAYDYYDFLNSPESELGVKNAQLVAAKNNLELSKKKLAAAEEFFANLEAIRGRIRSLSQQLDSSKATLSHEVDLANFIRMVTLEAKKVGLTIKGIKPETEVKRDYYIEVPFNIQIKELMFKLLCSLIALFDFSN